MPLYDFKCKDCGKVSGAFLKMDDIKGRNDFACPECGGKTRRLWTKPSAIVKSGIGDVLNSLHPHQTLVDVDGRPVKVNFVDHGDRSGLEGVAAAAGIRGARMDEKTGKPVVDVVSDKPDPLGLHKKGQTETSQINVNQKVRMPGQKGK